jgi:hypothetical protein
MFGTSVTVDSSLNQRCAITVKARGIPENIQLRQRVQSRVPPRVQSPVVTCAPVPPNIMGPADPQNSVLIPVVAGRSILLGSNSGLFLVFQLILRPLTERLDAVGSTRHPSDL